MTVKHLSSISVTGTVSASGGVITVVTDGAPTLPLADGAIAVDTTNDVIYYRSSGTWMQVTGGGGGGATDLADLNDVSLTTPLNGQYLQYDGTNWINATGSADVSIGFEDRTDSQISFNEGTRTFSISPTSSSFVVWCAGTRHVYSSAQTTTIDATSGLYYIYFDADGDLQHSNTFFDFETQAPVSYVYWNQTDGKAYYFADERHGITMDWVTHEYLHRTRGAAIAGGFGASAYITTGNGSSDSHAKIDIANGTFFDEDLEVVITHSATPTANTWQQFLQGGAQLPVFYKLNSHWVRTTPTSFPMKTNSTAQYNLYSTGNWGLADAGNGKFLISWIVATNNLNYPVIVVMGQAQYDNIGQAEAVGWEDVNLDGFPSIEFRPLHKVVFTTSSTYSNTPKSRIEGVYDFRRVMSSQDQLPTVPVTDHGNLTGLADDDHLQYLTENRHDAYDHSTALGTAVIGDLSDVSGTAASANSVLVWNGSEWAPTTSPTIGGNLTVNGDLTVNGTTTTINSTTLSVDDKNIELGSVSSPTDITAFQGGITLKGTTDKTFLWEVGAWASSEDINLASGKVFKIGATTVLSSSQVLGKSLPVTTIVGTADSQVLTFKTINGLDNTITNIGNSSLTNSKVTVGSTDISLGASATTIAGLSSVTSTSFTGELTGNASTATKWAAARTLSLSTDASGSASFDGSANATLALTLATVNSNTGSFGDSVTIPAITVNAKGLVTAVSTNSVRAGSTSQTGIVQLSDSTTSTSTSLAATANSIRQGNRDSYMRLVMEVV